MEEHRKNAYRYLLYWAMLDIRALAWLTLGWSQLNPFSWRSEVRRIRHAGALADAMHNLAFYSSHDFNNFDESRFWRDIQIAEDRYPEFGRSRYRHLFDHRLEFLRSEEPDGGPAPGQ